MLQCLNIIRLVTSALHLHDFHLLSLAVGCLSSFCSRNSARFEFSKEVLNIFRRLLPCPSKLFRKAFMVTHVVFNSVIHSSNVSGNIGLSSIHQMQSFGCIVVCM